MRENKIDIEILLSNAPKEQENGGKGEVKYKRKRNVNIIILEKVSE